MEGVKNILSTAACRDKKWEEKKLEHLPSKSYFSAAKYFLETKSVHLWKNLCDLFVEKIIINRRLNLAYLFPITCTSYYNNWERHGIVASITVGHPGDGFKPCLKKRIFSNFYCLSILSGEQIFRAKIVQKNYPINCSPNKNPQKKYF